VFLITGCDYVFLLTNGCCLKLEDIIRPFLFIVAPIYVYLIESADAAQLINFMVDIVERI